MDFAEYLLHDAKVAVVPGIAFGKSPFFRISYATSFDDLEKSFFYTPSFTKPLTSFPETGKS